MPTKKKKQNPLLMDLPPEDGDEWDLEDGGSPFSDIEGMPPELQPGAFYRYAMGDQTSQYQLYMAQLKDYWVDRIISAKKQLSSDFYYSTDAPTEGEQGKYLAKLTEQANQSLEEASAMVKFGFPLQSLPDYKQVSKMIGNNVQSLYIGWAQAGLQELESIEAERQDIRNRLLGDKYTTYGKFAPAIRRGYVTPKEADEALRGELPILNSKMGDTTARYAVADPAMRARLGQEVAAGRVSREEAFGAGSPWETWQHDEAAKLRATQGNADRTGLLEAIQQAEKAGVQIDENLAKQYLHPSMPTETQAMFTANLLSQVNNANLKRKQDYAGYLSRSYPDLYNTWATEGQAKRQYTDTSGYNPMNWYASLLDEEGKPGEGFLNAWRQKEKQRLTDYGGIYPSYMSYVNKTGYKDADVFEDWLTKDPQAMAWVDEKKKQDERRIAAQGRAIAPLGRYRG